MKREELVNQEPCEALAYRRLLCGEGSSPFAGLEPDPTGSKNHLAQREVSCRCRGMPGLSSYFLYSARRFLAHSGFTTCFARPIASESGGTASVITDPAPTMAPSPISIGAISVELLPTNAPSPMVVGCFLNPS